MRDVVEAARLVAYAAHGARGHTRRFSKAPYFVHPARTQAIIVKWAEYWAFDGVGQADVWAAALLHDVVEDTKLTLGDLEHLGFSADVVSYVRMLSIPPNLAANRATEWMLSTLEGAPLEVVLIKLADRTDNLLDWPPKGDEMPDRYTESSERLLALAVRRRSEIGAASPPWLRLAFTNGVNTLERAIRQVREAKALALAADEEA